MVKAVSKLWSFMPCCGIAFPMKKICYGMAHVWGRGTVLGSAVSGLVWAWRLGHRQDGFRSGHRFLNRCLIQYKMTVSDENSCIDETFKKDLPAYVKKKKSVK